MAQNENDCWKDELIDWRWAGEPQRREKCESLSFFVWLLLLAPFFWAFYVRFEDTCCLFPSFQLFSFLYFVLYFKLWQAEVGETFHCISAVFSNSFLLLCMCSSAPASTCVREWELLTQAFQLPSPTWEHHWCSSELCAPYLRGGTRTLSSMQSDWQQASFLETP